MAETNIIEAPSPAPTVGTSGLGHEAYARERADWVGRGLDGTAFDRAFGQAPAAAEPAPADVEPYDGGKFTPGQLAQMISDMRRVGVPDAEIEAALKADGYSDAELKPEPDTRTEGQRAFDADVPASPRDYRFDFRGRAGPDADLAKAHAELSQLAYDLAMPQTLASSALEATLDAKHAFEGMSPERVELRVRETAATILQHFRGDEGAAKTAVQDVDDLLAAASNQPLAQGLRTWIMASPEAFLTFWNWSTAVAAREGL